MKKRIKLLSILLSISLALNSTGCSNSNDGKIVDIKDIYVNLDDNNGNGEISDEINTNSPEKEKPKYIISILSKDEKNALSNQYLDYFKNITYKYPGEEYYLSDEEIKKLILKSDTTKICTHDKVITNINEVMVHIYANSQEYANSHDYVTSSFMDIKTENKNNYSHGIFEQVLKNIFRELLKESHNDIKEDFCQFNNLAICLGNLTDVLGIDGLNDYLILGYYDIENNAIIFDYDAICEEYEFLYQYYRSTGIYISLAAVLSATLAHEINHVRQSACDCRIKAGQEYAMIDYADFVSFLTEASAESDLYNSGRFISYFAIRSKTNDFSYNEERHGEALIQLLGLVNSSIDDYYEAIFDSNLNALFESLGATTYEDKANLCKIFYAIDGVNYRSDLAFSFEDSELLKYYSFKDVIGREYCYEIMNRFTIDLIEYINTHDDFNIIEALCLFNVAQSVCLEDMRYLYWDNDEIESAYYFDVVEKINDTRVKFYEYLKQFYGVDNKELLSIIREADQIIFIADRNMGRPEYDIIDSYRYEYFLELTEKFSLLKSIMFAVDADFYTYDRVYQDNGISLILE